MDPVPRWLDNQEQQSWRAFVRGINLVTRALDRDLRESCDITSDDYGVLVALSEAPGEQLRLGELAAELRVPKAHLTYRIQRMEKAGMVERAECADDGRGVFAVLTALGRELLETAAPKHVETVRRHVLDHLDRTQLLALGDAMQAVLDGHAGVSCDEAEAASGV